MVSKSQLPFLLKLLDDNSPSVREHIVRELVAFGPDLEDELQALNESLTYKQRMLLHGVLTAHHHSEELKAAWQEWPLLDGEAQKLETAYDLLAQFQYGWAPPVRVGELLDGLVAGFRAAGRASNPISLARFLFISLKLRGNNDDYYNPFNSNLIQVIQERHGIPITLVSVYMLVGARLGFDIRGCNIPGHFLARAMMDGKELLVDCYNSGRVLSAEEVDHLRETLSPQFRLLMDRAPSAEDMVVRILHNLINAYERLEDAERVQLVRDLLRHVAAHSAASAEAEDPASQ